VPRTALPWSRARAIPALAALLLLLAAPPARAGGADRLDNALRGEWPAAGIERVDCDFPVGTLEVTGGAEPAVRFEADAECNRGARARCEDMARELKLHAERRGNVLRIRIEGWRKFHHGVNFVLNGRLVVPAASHLDLDMAVGELTVRGVEGDLALGLGVGEAEVHRREHGLRSVRVDIGIGEATLDRGTQRMDRVSVLGSGLHWNDGTGTARLALKMGVGEASIVLD
jgi:hypothetical protein